MWEAADNEDPRLWTESEANSRITYWRLATWNTLPNTTLSCCVQTCRAEGRKRPRKETAVGALCLACWLDWPACEECGVAPQEPTRAGESRVKYYKGKILCAECLVPEIPSEAYAWWSLSQMLSIGSSFAYISNDIPALSSRLTQVYAS